MNSQQFIEEELEIIKERIHKLELAETEQDNSWKVWFHNLFHRSKWPNKETLLERKGIWQTIKKDIERKISLIKGNQLILSKYLTQLSKTEEKLAKIEAKLEEYKSIEESRKWGKIFLMTIVIILLIFALYMFGSGKWKIEK